MAASTKNIRFMSDNYAALSSATVTSSSDTTGFEIANVVDERRFKQWVPEGYFDITTSNNKLYFNDGADHTATITVGTYTAATLFAEATTQMNAVGTTTDNSVEFSSGNFRIQNTSVAWTLKVASTTDAIWDTIGFTGGIDISKSAGVHAFADETRIHTSEFVHVDFGVATECDFVSLIGPLNEAFALSNTATVTLMANSVDSFTSPPFSKTVTADTFGALLFFDDDASRSYRYWKLEIIDRDNANLSSSLVFGHFYLGAYDTVTSGNTEVGFSVEQVDPSIEMASENGTRFFNRRTNYLNFSGVQMLYVSAAERRTLQEMFYDLGIHTPFYVSFDPTLDISVEHQELTRYVTFATVPIFNHVFKDIYSIAMDFREAN